MEKKFCPIINGDCREDCGMYYLATESCAILDIAVPLDAHYPVSEEPEEENKEEEKKEE